MTLLKKVCDTLPVLYDTSQEGVQYFIVSYDTVCMGVRYILMSHNADKMSPIETQKNLKKLRKGKTQ